MANIVSHRGWNGDGRKTSTLSDQEEQISEFSSSDPWLLQVNECNKWKSRERVDMTRSKGTSA
ncbi:unnamed protein product [Ilex paraguariensis]|uniref:Uncharacterized protein n=1 Tax=Ilex paraguariensis TaxID=185542 RepID=A0ABC8S8X3_9AQUA